MVETILCKTVISYSHPNRRNRTPKCIALRYQVFAMIGYVIVCNKHNYYIHALWDTDDRQIH